MLMHYTVFPLPHLKNKLLHSPVTVWTSLSCLWNLDGGWLLPFLTKILQCVGGHVFGGVCRKMNLLFDTPLPLSYCEIWLALVHSLFSKSEEHVCVCVSWAFLVWPTWTNLKCNELNRSCRTTVIRKFNPVGWCWGRFSDKLNKESTE